VKSFTSVRVSQELGTYQKLNSDLEKKEEEAAEKTLSWRYRQLTGGSNPTPRTFGA
jgi:hypothetical protein